MALNVLIIGGHGKISLRLARLLSAANHNVSSVIRNLAQEEDIKKAGAKPVVLSLEEGSVEDFTKLLSSGFDVVYFSAGAGGNGGEERTKAVDYEGAVKVFDALEKVEGKIPRLITVSGIDIHDPEKTPEHYDDADKAISARVRSRIAAWYHWKYEADKNLSKRTAFKWFILRPGGLTEGPATGKAAIGRTHITTLLSREDAAQVLFLLVGREDINGLALDVVGGETPISEALDAAIAKGETDFLG